MSTSSTKPRSAALVYAALSLTTALVTDWLAWRVVDTYEKQLVTL